MMRPKRHFGVSVINILMISFLFLLHYSGIFTVRVWGASPLILLPFLVALSMFCYEWSAALAGLVTGVFMDAVSSSPGFFNSAFFFLAALLVSLTVRYLFNNNIRSAIALSLTVSILYFLLKWLIVYAIGGVIDDSLLYLLRFALPSVLFTSIFILPFYYLERGLYRRMTDSAR